MRGPARREMTLGDCGFEFACVCFFLYFYFIHSYDRDDS